MPNQIRLLSATFSLQFYWSNRMRNQCTKMVNQYWNRILCSVTHLWAKWEKFDIPFFITLLYHSHSSMMCSWTTCRLILCNWFHSQERIEEMWIWTLWGLLYGCDSQYWWRKSEGVVIMVTVDCLCCSQSIKMLVQQCSRELMKFIIWKWRHLEVNKM